MPSVKFIAFSLSLFSFQALVKLLLLTPSRMLELFMQLPLHVAVETSQYVAVIRFIGTRMLIRIRWEFEEFSLFYKPNLCSNLNSHGNGAAVRLTSTLASDSLESSSMCERSKAMLAARWICTTIRREERWDEMNDIDSFDFLLSSLKPDFSPWEPKRFCFYCRIQNERKNPKKSFFGSCVLERIYLHIMFYIILTHLNVLRFDLISMPSAPITT